MKKKLIEVALPLEAINKESAQREVDPSRPPLDATSLVGAAASCGLPGCAVRFAGR